jgi:hypothetical protein
VETRVRLSPLTLMFARSGVGKSSFLISRAIPTLSQSSPVEYLNEWGSEDPCASVQRGLLKLYEAAAQAGEHLEEKPILILDQFEDVFKLRFDRAPLWDNLAAIANIADSPAHLLISMREEWLGAWEEAAQYLPDSTNSLVRLSPLTDSELRRAIREPVRIEGTLAITDELVSAILADLKQDNAFGLGDRFVEPGLLQLVCRKLWEEARNSNQSMNFPLYEKLGKSDLIIRGFVWNELKSANHSTDRFSPADRVLWVGLAKYLTVTSGVKSIVSAEALALKLRVIDLGISGPAFIWKMLKRSSRNYLARRPENRGPPPTDLQEWISKVVSSAAEAGLLKRQRSTMKAGSESEATITTLYELSHDALGEIFQAFSVSFESWITKRVYFALGAISVSIFFLPFLVMIALREGIREALLYAVLIPVGLALYVGFIYIVAQIFQFIAAIIWYPLVRVLAKGRVPEPVKKR